jgi:hypothetical protein
MTLDLRVRIVEPEETADARQPLGKYDPAATNTHAENMEHKLTEM